MEAVGTDYLVAAADLMKEMFCQDWMTEEEWQAVLKYILRKGGMSLESMAKDLEIGVKNGYSIEQQKGIAKFAIKMSNEV